MKRKGILILAIVAFNSHVLLGQIPTWEWAKQWGHQSTPSTIHTDLNNNIYVAGNFYGNSSPIGTIILPGIDSLSQTSFLAKFDYSGHPLWAKSMMPLTISASNSLPPSSKATAVSIDLSGNVVVVGTFDGTMMILGSDTLHNTTNYGTAPFIAKYDSSGNIKWARTALLSYYGSTYHFGVATDGEGNAYVCGQYVSSVSFGSFNLSTGGNCAYLVKYSSSGDVVWAKQPFSSGTVNAAYASIASDPEGNGISVAGSFNNDSLVFGNTTIYNLGSVAAVKCPFAVKFDTSGSVVWVHSFRTTNANQPAFVKDISVDKRGNTILTGAVPVPGQIIFDHDTLTSVPTQGGLSYIVKYDHNGHEVWARTVRGNPSSQFQGLSLAIDTACNIYAMVGTAYANYLIVDIDSIALGINMNPYFVVKYDSMGRYQWLKSDIRNTNQSTYSVAIATDKSGDIYTTGGFRDTIYFGTESVACTHSQYQSYIAKLDTFPPLPVILGMSYLKDDQISISPNPTTGLVILKDVPERTQLIVSDISGRELLIRDIDKSISEQDMSLYSSGIYFFRFISSEGKSIHRIIVTDR